MRTCQCRPNTTSVELAPKTLADLHCKLFGNTEQKNFIYRKKILSDSVCKKNCVMSAEKYQSGQFNNRCRVLFFQFNPSLIFFYGRWRIFVWCYLKKLQCRSARFLRASGTEVVFRPTLACSDLLG